MVQAMKTTGLDWLQTSAVCFAAILAVASASAQPGALATQIAQHEQSLAQARSSKNIRQQVSESNILGALYYSSGQLEKAQQYVTERVRPTLANAISNLSFNAISLCIA